MKDRSNIALAVNWATFIAFMVTIVLTAHVIHDRMIRLHADAFAHESARQMDAVFAGALGGLGDLFGEAAKRLERAHAACVEAFAASSGPVDYAVLKTAAAAHLGQHDDIEISVVTTNPVIAETIQRPDMGVCLSQFRRARSRGTIEIVYPVIESNGSVVRASSCAYVEARGAYVQLHLRNWWIDQEWQRLRSVAAALGKSGAEDIIVVMTDSATGQRSLFNLFAGTPVADAETARDITEAIETTNSVTLARLAAGKLIEDHYLEAPRALSSFFRVPGVDVRLVYHLTTDTTMCDTESHRGLLLLLGLLVVLALLSIIEYAFLLRRYVQPLRASRQMLQDVLNTIPVRVFWKDRLLRYMGCNKLFADDSGLSSPEAMMGRTDHEMSWRAQADLYRTDDLAVMKTGAPKLNYEEPQESSGSRFMWVRTSKIPLRNTTGAVIGVLGTYEDITAWKHAKDEVHQRLVFEQALAHLAQRLADTAEVPRMVTSELRDLGRALGADRASMFRIHEGQVIDMPYQWAARTELAGAGTLSGMRLGAVPWMAQALLQTGRLVVNDVAQLPPEAAVERRTWERGTVGAVLAVPLHQFGGEEGFISVMTAGTAHAWRDDEITFLTTCAQIVSGALERHDSWKMLQRYQHGLEEQVAARTAELRAANEQLRASENLYMSTINALQEWIHVVDGTYRILFANNAYNAALREFGMTTHAVGKDLFEVAPFLVDKVRHEYKQVFASGEPVVTEEMHMVGDRAVYTETKKTPVVADGRVARVVTSIADVTTRKLTEEQMARFAALIESSGEFIGMATLDGRVFYLNRAGRTMMGIGLNDDIRTTTITDYVFDDLKRQVNDEVMTAVKATGRWQGDGVLRHLRTNEPIAVAITTILLPAVSDVAQPCVATVMRDVTMQNQTMTRLREHEDQLRSMALQLTIAEEQERRRIATGLHDVVCQTLAMVKMKLGMTKPGSVNAAMLRRLGKDVDAAIASLRTLTFDLSPPALHEIGLEAALEWLADRINQQYGIACACTIHARPESLDETTRTILFLAVRELLMNAVKHAKARHITISATVADGQFRIAVADDGKGMAGMPADGDQDSFGLFSVRERLRHLGGSLALESRPGKGTTAVLTAPLQPR